LEVAGEDGHHLARVLRLRPGEVVTVADGAGTWRPYRVGAADGPADPFHPDGGPRPARPPGAAAVRLDAAGAVEREPELPLRLAVGFALTKGEKPDLTVQKLTELGVDRIVPVLAERSVSRPDADKAAAMAERWRRIAREAARQCRRATLPVVEEVRSLADLAGHPGLVVAERGGRPPPELGPPVGGELLVVVGPEGGFTDDEVEG